MTSDCPAPTVAENGKLLIVTEGQLGVGVGVGVPHPPQGVGVGVPQLPHGGGGVGFGVGLGVALGVALGLATGQFVHPAGWQDSHTNGQMGTIPLHVNSTPLSRQTKSIRPESGVMNLLSSLIR